MTDSDSDTLEARESAARALGLNPKYIHWVSGDDKEEWIELTTPSPRDLKVDRLSDCEWKIISGTGLIPDEPRQASMTQREMLDAVLTIVGRQRAWTELDRVNVSSEAVRKKFARLARKGVWQALALMVDDLDLSPARRSILKSIGNRAQQMVGN